MTIKIAVDTICYHMPLEAGLITIDEIVDHTAQVGADALQLDLHDVRTLDLEDLARLRKRVEDKGVVMNAHGGEIGSPRNGLAPTTRSAGSRPGWSGRRCSAARSCGSILASTGRTSTAARRPLRRSAST